MKNTASRKDSTGQMNSSDNNTPPGSLCPRVTKPYSDCYCYDMSSQKIAQALIYCGGNYNVCEIYRSHSIQDGTNRK